MTLLFYSAGYSPALIHAITLLKHSGIPFTEHSDLTATHLLLPVPSFSGDGTLIGGGQIEAILPQLSKDITIVGGNLEHPALKGYTKIDLLKNAEYLTQNAAITAHCAIRYILNNVPFILQDCPVLVIGWGRIGKCLGNLLKGMGANVTVATRKDADRAMARALGYNTISTKNLNPTPYKVILNTAPASIMNQAENALNIDLASTPGIIGPDVIRALRLPGKDAPASSGQCIAQTVLQLLNQGECI